MDRAEALLCAAGGFFGIAILINIIRVYAVPPRVRKYIPIPMALGKRLTFFV